VCVDADGDPSVHPKTATIFLLRSASDKHRKSMHHALAVSIFSHMFSYLKKLLYKKASYVIIFSPCALNIQGK